MNFITSRALLVAAVPMVSAFPAAVLERVKTDPEMAARALEINELMQRRRAGELDAHQAGADAATAIFEPTNTFNAAEQFIDVGPGSGHEYVAPGSGDLRGPCPGLNALANHGFLPHNGYATMTQYFDATTTVLGMGPQLAGFLALLGAAIDGDLLAWSMGGTPSIAQGGLTGPLGKGLIGSHNKYEGDASPTRGDLYQAGDNCKTIPSQFQDLINNSPGSVTLDSLTAFRSKRFDDQIASNKYFFNGPFSGVLVQPAAYTFIYRFMANHSQENPAGLLSHETLQSWFGMTGTNGNYQAQQGAERIPLNWYRRAQAYPYEVDYFFADVLSAAALYPKFLDIGGNTGTTNSFTNVDVANLTGGLFNTASLAEGNNLGCFAYQLSAQAKPDIALGGLLNTLIDTIGPLVAALGCPQLQAIDEAQLKRFPGYSQQPVYG